MIRNAALILVVLAGCAFAQQSDQNTNITLLAGPCVAESNVTGLASTFVESEGNDRVRMMGRADGAVLRQILPEFRTADDPDLRLTAEQDAAIADVIQGFQVKAASFEREHARELRQLRQQIGDMRSDRPATDRARPQAEPTPADSMAPEMMVQRNEAQTRLAELNAQRPNPADLEKPIRAILSERQREYLDQRIEALARERFEQRAMEQARKDVANQFAKQQPRQVSVDRLPERLRQRIESLPPEEQAAALERVREMYTQRGQQRDAAPRRNPNAEKPAPSMDRVTVPKPGGG